MTNSRPWEADRPLTLGIARAVVASAFPGVAAASLELLGSGWEFDVFRTRDGWAIRFPRRAEAESLFERERPVLEMVRSVLAPPVAVPPVESGATPWPIFRIAWPPTGCFRASRRTGSRVDCDLP